MKNIFGENLRRLRIAKNYTQEQAAQLLHISPKSLSRWECGSTMPDVMILPEIARLYGVLHEYMSTVCTRKAFELYDKSMTLCKEKDSELYYRVKRQKNMLRAQRSDGQVCIEEQRNAIREDPGNVDEYTCLAAALYAEKMYEECYYETKEAIAKFPQEAMLYIYAGDCCRELKKYGEAFAYWKKHQELDTKWLDTYYSMGFCYEEIGEYGEAYKIWVKLAEILTERGNVVEAEWPKEMAQRCKEKIHQ